MRPPRAASRPPLAVRRHKDPTRPTDTFLELMTKECEWRGRELSALMKLNAVPTVKLDPRLKGMVEKRLAALEEEVGRDVARIDEMTKEAIRHNLPW